MLRLSGFPAIVDASGMRVGMAEWMAENNVALERGLLQSGAVLLRGTGIDTAEKFDRFVVLMGSDIPSFREESSPRSVVRGHVMTSTDYPSEFPIQFHSEYSYAAEWPRKLLFCCLQPPEWSGETPIADNRMVLANMRPETRAVFKEKGVLYVRSYRPDVGVSWQVAFRTEDPTTVATLCKQAGMVCNWRPDGVLQTRQLTAAIVRHPVTDTEVWFNHGFFFNVRAVEPVTLREGLLSYPPDEPLSTNTLFGDGSPIGAEIIEEIRSLYLAASTRLPWVKEDVLMIDNMLTAHARAPFRGARNIVVAMTDRIMRTAIRASARA